MSGESGLKSRRLRSIDCKATLSWWVFVLAGFVSLVIVPPSRNFTEELEVE
jgi:hypothetical protein